MKRRAVLSLVFAASVGGAALAVLPQVGAADPGPKPANHWFRVTCVGIPGAAAPHVLIAQGPQQIAGKIAECRALSGHVDRVELIPPGPPPIDWA